MNNKNTILDILIKYKFDKITEGQALEIISDIIGYTPQEIARKLKVSRMVIYNYTPELIKLDHAYRRNGSVFIKESGVKYLKEHIRN